MVIMVIYMGISNLILNRNTSNNNIVLKGIYLVIFKIGNNNKDTFFSKQIRNTG